MNWWLASCIVSAIIAVIIAFVLGAFWLADSADAANEELMQRIERELRSGK